MQVFVFVQTAGKLDLLPKSDLKDKLPAPLFASDLACVSITPSSARVAVVMT